MGSGARATGSAAGTFVSYDDKKAIGLKAKYIVDNGARGAIIWELTGDYLETAPGSGIVAGTPLVDTLNQVFCGSATSVANSDFENTIRVYPNPSSGNVFVELKNTTAAELIIMDIKGAEILRLHLTNSLNEINLEAFSRGLYFIKLNANNQSYYSKLVKE